MRKLALLLGLLGLQGAWATTFATVPDTLKRVFPGGEVKEKHLYLRKKHKAALSEKTGDPHEQPNMVTYFEVFHKGVLQGYAFIDTHVVRTMYETILISLTPQGKVQDITVLSFLEPKDYLPQRRWLDQYQGRTPHSDPAVVHVAGATMSSQAIERSYKRVGHLIQQFRVLASSR